MVKETACDRFKAKVMPYVDSSKLDVLRVRLGDDDKVVVGYTQLTDSTTSFLRFIVDDVGGRSVITPPFVRCVAEGFAFTTIIADDEGQALDKLADWFIANYEAITQSRSSWQAY